MTFPEPMPAATETIGNHAPDTTVETGVTDGSIAASLEIHYLPGGTYVVPVGEAMNDEPWRFRGEIPPADVLAEYLDAMRDQ